MNALRTTTAVFLSTLILLLVCACSAACPPPIIIEVQRVGNNWEAIIDTPIEVKAGQWLVLVPTFSREIMGEEITFRLTPQLSEVAADGTIKHLQLDAN